MKYVIKINMMFIIQSIAFFHILSVYTGFQAAPLKYAANGAFWRDLNENQMFIFHAIYELNLVNRPLVFSSECDAKPYI